MRQVVAEAEVYLGGVSEGRCAAGCDHKEALAALAQARLLLLGEPEEGRDVLEREARKMLSFMDARASWSPSRETFEVYAEQERNRLYTTAGAKIAEALVLDEDERDYEVVVGASFDPGAQLQALDLCQQAVLEHYACLVLGLVSWHSCALSDMTFEKFVRYRHYLSVPRSERRRSLSALDRDLGATRLNRLRAVVA